VCSPAAAISDAASRRLRGSRCSKGSSSHRNDARVEAPSTSSRVASNAITFSPLEVGRQAAQPPQASRSTSQAR